jgi:pimeloyl-ACP methyl ester carboxylesterase
MPTLHSMGRILNYGAEGAGTPVVALHGSASTGAQWRSLVAHLAPHHRVLTPDLAGYSRSGKPAAPVTMATEAMFLRPLLAEAGDPVHLVGHSFGGAVALAVAVTIPERVRSLTLIEPAAFRLLATGDHTDIELGAEIAAVARDIRGEAIAHERTAATARFIDYWNGAGAFARSSTRLQNFAVNSLDRVMDNFAALAAPGLTRRALAGITCPTLIIAGLNTRLPALRTAEIVAEIIPGARLDLVPGAGHMLPLTDPHLTDPMIADAVARAEGRPARTAPEAVETALAA